MTNDFYMTANFYRNTFFNQLITTTAAEGVETYVATLVFAYENQGLDLYLALNNERVVQYSHYTRTILATTPSTTQSGGQSTTQTSLK